jgi:Arf-GAP/coiled-coil/ANK repeat/PH domain-containing protein
MNFISVDLQEAKESRHRFDKAAHSYDQSREKFVSLKKNTRGEIVAELEEVEHLFLCISFCLLSLRGYKGK